MKTVIILVLIVFSIVAIGAMTYEKPITTEVIVLSDVTDSLASKPATDDVLKFISSNNMWNGALFSYRSISDVSINKTLFTSLMPENKWLSNEIERSNVVKEFNNRVEKIIATSSADSIGREQTSVYIPLVESLNGLSVSSSERKVLLVFSDLMENTSDVSFYVPSTLKQMEVDTPGIAKILSSHTVLNEIPGVEVYFVFQPLDVQSDNRYRIVSTFYKMLLEEKGAVVHIVSNI